MSNDLIATSSPDEDPPNRDEADREPHNKQDTGSEERRRKKGAEIPSAEDCLRAIAALPGLIAIRALTNAQANSIRASYESILRHHERSQDAPARHASDDHILKLVREQPGLLDLLEPFLTQDQLTIIMKEFKDDTPEEA
jgi:hypothetical protein